MEQQRAIFSESHNQFRDTVRRFYQREIEPNVKEWEKIGMFPEEVFHKAAKAGILCSGIPEEYGGGGGDFLHHVILHEEAGYSPAGASLEGGLGVDGAGYMLLYGGTEEQKKEWLPRFATGEVISEGGFTEPHSGSDVASMRTFARRDGSDWILNGSKIWITNGMLTTMLIVAAKTDDSKRVSLFMVDVDMPGVSRAVIPTLHKGSGTVAEFFFQDVRLPADRLLGMEEGQGFRQVMSVLNEMRMAESARYLCAAELAFQLTVDFVRERKAFGQRILDFQNTQFKLADIKTELTVGRAFMDSLLGRSVNGKVDPLDSAMGKLWISELEFRVMDQCMQFFGGMSYAQDMPISHMWTQARIHRILLGTSEIHRQTIGRSIG